MEVYGTSVIIRSDILKAAAYGRYQNPKDLNWESELAGISETVKMNDQVTDADVDILVQGETS